VHFGPRRFLAGNGLTHTASNAVEFALGSRRHPRVGLELLRTPCEAANGGLTFGARGAKATAGEESRRADDDSGWSFLIAPSVALTRGRPTRARRSTAPVTRSSRTGEHAGAGYNTVNHGERHAGAANTLRATRAWRRRDRLGRGLQRWQTVPGFGRRTTKVYDLARGGSPPRRQQSSSRSIIGTVRLRRL